MDEHKRKEQFPVLPWGKRIFALPFFVHPWYKKICGCFRKQLKFKKNLGREGVYGRGEI